MNCPNCLIDLVEGKEFVSQDALIRGYNYIDESDLYIKDGIRGKDIRIDCCPTCNYTISTAGRVMFSDEYKRFMDAQKNR